MIRRFFAFLGLHIGRNQDFYIWPLIPFAFYLIARWAVYYGTGRQPLSDLAVNLSAIDGYATLTIPIFLSLFWASLAGRFLTWTFKSHSDWSVADWKKQLVDVLTPLTVFVSCLVYFSRHS